MIEVTKIVTFTTKTKYDNKYSAFEDLTDDEIISAESDKTNYDIVSDIEFCDHLEINSIEVKINNDNQ